MKIAQISATFPPYMGGTGNVCYYYSIELAKLGHDVTVFTTKYDENTLRCPESISVKRYKPLFKFGNAPIIPQLLNIRNYDIIHLHCPYFVGDLAVFLGSRLRGKKLVITYHNDVIIDNWIGKFSNIYNTTIQNYILSKSNKIFVTSMDYANNSKIVNIVRSKKRDIVEIPNGVDPIRFNPNINGSEIINKYNLENKVVFLFVGALDKAHFFKGLNVLLNSFEKIQNENKILLIIGDGDLKESYVSLVNKLKISEKVLFLGRISDLDLPKYYSAADIVILPSTTMGEAFGVVLLEAMATGKAVIASNLPGVRSVVDEGINGLLVMPKNSIELTKKMEYLMENKICRQKFGLNGRKKVEEKYNWESIVKNMELSYCELLL